MLRDNDLRERLAVEMMGNRIPFPQGSEDDAA